MKFENIFKYHNNFPDNNDQHSYKLSPSSPVDGWSEMTEPGQNSYRMTRCTPKSEIFWILRWSILSIRIYWGKKLWEDLIQIRRFDKSDADISDLIIECFDRDESCQLSQIIYPWSSIVFPPGLAKIF